ncbi:DUF6745 domain-containing protein [Actinoplanes sp. CA-015351]|uniref:DUF6745 domain-containing protein n=1 Tax=Actinoplanes sp. CA-015351 TaxID=3239897 RepID=UPI003D96DD7D
MDSEKPLRRLTVGQETKLLFAANRWRRPLDPHHPVDPAAAEAALTMMYEFLKVPMPPVLWVDSPGAATELLRDAGEMLPAAEGYRSGQYRIDGLDPMPGQSWLIEGIGWTLGQEVDESALALVAELMGTELGSWYAPPVEGSHGYGTLSPSASAIRATVFADRSVRAGYDAWLTAYWVGFYDAIGQAGLIEYWPAAQERLDALMALADSGAGWWWPFRDRCVVSLRPVEMATEHVASARGPVIRPHRADGPAMTFLDGWTRYAWRGVPVPESLIEQGWTAERLLREAGNPELRRCAIERLGWHRFLDATGLQPMTPPVPDPSRPGRTLALYDVPRNLVQRGGVRVLVLGEGGRRFSTEVAGFHDDPVEAASHLAGRYRVGDHDPAS